MLGASPLPPPPSPLQAANASTAAEARYEGVLDAIVRILRLEGVLGLYKGLRVRCAHSACGCLNPAREQVGWGEGILAAHGLLHLDWLAGQAAKRAVRKRLQLCPCPSAGEAAADGPGRSDFNGAYACFQGGVCATFAQPLDRAGRAAPAAQSLCV